MIFDRNYYKKHICGKVILKMNDEENPRVSIHVLKKNGKKTNDKIWVTRGPTGDGAPTPGHPSSFCCSGGHQSLAERESASLSSLPPPFQLDPRSAY